MLNRQILPDGLHLGNQGIVGYLSLPVLLSEVSECLLEDEQWPDCIRIRPPSDSQVRFINIGVFAYNDLVIVFIIIVFLDIFDRLLLEPIERLEPFSNLMQIAYLLCHFRYLSQLLTTYHHSRLCLLLLTQRNLILPRPLRKIHRLRGS